jgi:Zn-finger nucleic acid-binding protein
MASLQGQTYEGDVQVDLCASCGGLWLDRGELEAIQQTVEHDCSDTLNEIGGAAGAYELARQKALPGIACPRCRRPLVAREYGYCSQILIDACPDCEGVWLDGGEMQALEQFFERLRPGVVERARRSGVRRAFFAGLKSVFGG